MRTITKISILNGLILLCLTLSEFFGLIKFDLLLSYHWHKILHIIGVVLFMGNMIVGPIWFMYAYLSKDKTLLKFAAKLLELTDIYLTIPGIALTIINGLYLASVYGGTKNQPWLFYSIILLFVMWALSIPLICLQEKMYQSLDKEFDLKIINTLLIRWSILGTFVMIPPSVIFYLMIVKTIWFKCKKINKDQWTTNCLKWWFRVICTFLFFSSLRIFLARISEYYCMFVCCLWNWLLTTSGRYLKQ